MRKERGKMRDEKGKMPCGAWFCMSRAECFYAWIRAESLSACLVWTHAVRPSLNRDSSPAMCMRPSHSSAIPQVFTKKKGKRRNG